VVVRTLRVRTLLRDDGNAAPFPVKAADDQRLGLEVGVARDRAVRFEVVLGCGAFEAAEKAAGFDRDRNELERDGVGWLFLELHDGFVPFCRWPVDPPVGFSKPARPGIGRAPLCAGSGAAGELNA